MLVIGAKKGFRKRSSLDFIKMSSKLIDIFNINPATCTKIFTFGIWGHGKV